MIITSQVLTLTPLLLDTSVRTTQPAYDSVGTTIAGNSIVFPLTIEAKSVWELTYFVRGASAALTAPSLFFLEVFSLV